MLEVVTRFSQFLFIQTSEDKSEVEEVVVYFVFKSVVCELGRDLDLKDFVLQR